MVKPTRTFTDIDLNFIAHPVTGDITKKNDTEAIKQSVHNLVLTNAYERPFHPEINSLVNSLLFENETPILATLIERAITQTIENFEPRVRLVNVEATSLPDNNLVYVTIDFIIVNTSTQQSINLILKRTR